MSQSDPSPATLEEMFTAAQVSHPECEKESFYLGAMSLYAHLTSASSPEEAFQRMQDTWAEIKEFEQHEYRGGGA